MQYPVVATSEGVFSYMQRLLNTKEQYFQISPYVRQNFALLRTNAEKMARFRFIRDEVERVTVEQIYDALSMTGELDVKEIRSLMLLEKEAEEAVHVFGVDVATEKEDNSLAWFDGLEDDFSAQLLAGASKCAIAQKHLQGPARLGAKYGGPTLMPYVEWILCRSQSLGIKRLYFIARDGYVIKRMADVLIDCIGLDIKTYYIYGSRRAWRMPSYSGKAGELRTLVGWASPQHIHTVEEFADVLQIPIEKLIPFLPEEYAQKGRRLNFIELSFCVYLLDRNEAFREMLKELMANSRKLVSDYLKQEVDTCDGKFAFVEVGGSGLTQMCLSNIMKDFYDGRIRTFFYKMDRVHNNNDRCAFNVFFPSRLSNHLIIEMLCRAPEGQTERYRRDGEIVLPVKRDGDAIIYKEHGYEEYIRGLDEFTKAYTVAEMKLGPEPSLRASFVCMEYISSLKDKEAVDYFMGLPNRITGREDMIINYAPILTKNDLRNIFIRYIGDDGWSYYKGSDFDMSVKRSAVSIQKLEKKYQRYGEEIRKRWLRLYSPTRKKYMEMNGFGAYPYSVLGKKIVIYGAGQKGRELYESLQQNRVVTVVQWLDRNYAELKKTLPIDGGIEMLGNVPYDCIIIAMAQKSSWSDVKQELLAKGVPEGKIFVLPELESQWLEVTHSYLHV